MCVEKYALSKINVGYFTVVSVVQDSLLCRSVLGHSVSDRLGILFLCIASLMLVPL